MFIFQYEGLHQKLFPGEKYPHKKLIDAGLDSLIDMSREYIGETVIVVFDNARDEKRKFTITGDLVNSTFRQGILKDVTKPKKIRNSIITFEDYSNGKKFLAPIATIKMIDMVSVQDLSYPTYTVFPKDVFPEELQFFFRFFYYCRGDKGMLHYNPLGAFIDEKSKIIRKDNECKQAFFSNLLPTSGLLAYDEGLPERSSREYNKLSMQEDFVKNRTYIIRCGRRGQ